MMRHILIAAAGIGLALGLAGCTLAPPPEIRTVRVPIAVEVPRAPAPAECAGPVPDWLVLPEEAVTVREAWALGGRHYERLAGRARICAAHHAAESEARPPAGRSGAGT